MPLYALLELLLLILHKGAHLHVLVIAFLHSGARHHMRVVSRGNSCPACRLGLGSLNQATRGVTNAKTHMHVLELHVLPQVVLDCVLAMLA